MLPLGGRTLVTLMSLGEGGGVGEGGVGGNGGGVGVGGGGVGAGDGGLGNIVPEIR